jgi:hypothetical protein
MYTFALMEITMVILVSSWFMCSSEDNTSRLNETGCGRMRKGVGDLEFAEKVRWDG